MRNVIPTGDILVGVLGAFRGEAFARTAKNSGMKLVAICDNFAPRLQAVCARLDVPGYADFEEFIRQDFHAVVVASSFHQHAPFAIQAMAHGKHVLSETSCNITLAEGVALYQKARETGLCYMLAENYCYTRFVQEMKRRYDQGEIGEVRYAEGQYNHPMSVEETLWYSPGATHWRNQLPGCYYNTHALAPLMYITGTLPVEVACSLIPPRPANPAERGFHRDAFVMLVRMDNGAIFRLMGGVAGHSCWYGLHGTTGAMESTRGHGYFGPETVRIWHEPWDLGEGMVEEQTYLPRWPSHEKEAEETGHGGGDFFVEYHFAQAIRTGTQPYLDAFRGITMSNVGILAWRSAHQNGRFVRVPDLRDPADQAEMAKDRLTPFAGVQDGELMPDEMRSIRVLPAQIHPLAREVWQRIGYTDAEIDALLNE